MDISDCMELCRANGFASITEAVTVARTAKAEIERLQAAKRAALAIADERSKENVALRAALKPFANAAGAWDGEPPELWVEFAAYDAKPSPGACVADFRAARQAVQ